ncbi:MAG: peptidylprolyl isomerase, partial [Spirochaetaceae bacterium]
DFVIQTGDPRGDGSGGPGSGGPGYEFPNEISDSLRHDEAGVVSMANSGPHTNGSQFFITRGPAPWLDGQYSVFGHVVEGQDVVDEIEEGDTLEEVTVIRRGPEAREFEVDQAAFDRRVEALRAELSEEQQASIAEQLDYIERNWPEARETDEGLRYVVEQEGTGTRPQKGDEVAVEYTGYLLNGMPFESTENRDEPVTFTVGTGEVIEGWDRTLLDMTVGERRTVIVPPELGYGSDGARGIIPPNSFLVFEVELTDVRAGE